MEKITTVVVSYVPSARLVDTAGQDISFSLPASDVMHFEKLFLALEDRRTELGIFTYGVSATTLEDVFLRIAEKAENSPEARTSGGLHTKISMAQKTQAGLTFVNPAFDSTGSERSSSRLVPIDKVFVARA